MKDLNELDLSKIADSIISKHKSTPIKHKLLNRLLDWFLIACCVFYYFFNYPFNPFMMAIFVGVFIYASFRELFIL